MNKKNIFFVVVLFVFLGIYFLSSKEESKNNLDIISKTVTEEKLDSAWIEVISGRAFLVGSTTEKELFSGDKIFVPAKLKTDEAGESDIHFLDGSVMRAGASSTFDLTSASFEKDTGKIGVIAKLSVGRIWSKIVELATPDSVWQVETSNTVATVRGSAFGISTDGKTSNIVGSQHKIAVDFKDPKSGKKLNISSKIVEEGSLLKISEDSILKLKEISDKKVSEDKKKAEAEKLFASVMAPENIVIKTKASDPWIKQNEFKDAEIEKDIESSKLKHKDNKDNFREELQKNVLEKFGKIRKERKNKINVQEQKFDSNKNNDIEIIPKEDIKVDIKIETKPEPKEVEAETSDETSFVPPLVPASGGEILPIKLEIAVVSKELTGVITEGGSVHFRAILYGNGKQISDVTDKVKWDVLGPIGYVDGRGVLNTKLDQSVAEVGEGSGFIVTTWTDEKTGNKILGKSPLVKVVPNIEQPIDIGGQ